MNLISAWVLSWNKNFLYNFGRVLILSAIVYCPAILCCTAMQYYTAAAMHLSFLDQACPQWEILCKISKWELSAITEMVPNLIWAPDFFGPQETSHHIAFSCGTQTSCNPNFSGSKSLGAQISQGPEKSEAQMRLGTIFLIGIPKFHHLNIRYFSYTYKECLEMNVPL